MNLFISQSHNNFETFYEDSLRWTLEFKKLCNTKFSGKIDLVDVGTVQVGKVKLNGKIEQSGLTPKGYRTLVIPSNNSQPFNWLNKDVNSNDLLIFSTQGDLKAISFDAFHNYIISIEENLFDEIMNQYKLINLGRKLDSSEKVIQSNRGFLIYIQTYLEMVFDQLRREPELIHSTSFLYSIQHGLPLKILSFLDGKELLVTDSRSRKRDIAIEKCKNYVAEHTLNDISLTRLTEISDVSERTIELAFLERYGLTPVAYINAIKFNEARNTILTPSNKELISDVAKRIGFNHMGQFSAGYKKLFGELPSETTLRLRNQKNREPDLMELS